jgi:hypothetical protein
MSFSVGRHPSLSSSQPAGHGIVSLNERGEPAKEFSRFFRRFAEDWHIQNSANDLGDLADRNGLFRHRMISGASIPIFQRKPEEIRRASPHPGPPRTRRPVALQSR